MKTPPILVLAGPTAVGKGTVVRRLRELYPQIVVSVSATTRRPRPGEVDGADYFFVSDEQFDTLISSDALLEWATVHGRDRYGTPREWVEAQVRAGHPVILEIDLDGARQVRETLPSAVFVFLLPPSWEELVKRLTGRGTESVDERQRRLETAKVELAAASEFDHCVINDNVDNAVQKLASLLGLD
ncbi:guanylate kinase [Actinomycetaceae bacterium WB03_NA08]|uniref:Guanylate kinase n=1 Tax=Scrofimicrobium canadense TaxID=2652290 RepID=A0A6N7W6Q6_9ACTO|nr:guanylate kinase [Scrofimicrobium canadense]MSS83916.1 guanylate kinase [Scrofimicrobium canadense]